MTVLAFYTLLFGIGNRDYRNSFQFVIWLLPITALTTYFLNYYLIPRYLLTKKYALFSLYFIYTLIISITLSLNVVMLTLVSIADFNIMNMTPASFNIFYLIAGNYLVVFFAVAIKLLNLWYGMQNRNLLLEKEGIEIELKLKEAELKLLKAQIHPHFLFNTLNNLYGLTLSQSDRAPDVVLKISSLLDYMLYRSNKPVVDLEEEFNYIKDYIQLEKLRYSKLKMTEKFPLSSHGYKIAPLILLPFVENAFKHGISKDIKSPWINIDSTLQDNQLVFMIENSKTSQTDHDPAGYTQGIGLQNVNKRLAILYPGAYELDINDTDNIFKVELNLELKGLIHDSKMPDR
jgi:sensor histidine kinase YesM